MFEFHSPIAIYPTRSSIAPIARTRCVYASCTRLQSERNCWQRLHFYGSSLNWNFYTLFFGLRILNNCHASAAATAATAATALAAAAAVQCNLNALHTHTKEKHSLIFCMQIQVDHRSSLPSLAEETLSQWLALSLGGLLGRGIYHLLATVADNPVRQPAGHASAVTERQADRQRDRRIDEQTVRQTDRERDEQANVMRFTVYVEQS